jgi:two-component system LytT family response regulator
MKLKCLAIDDEPMALEIITDYVEKTPFLVLDGAYRDSIKALDYLQQYKVDLIFLDINMPDLTGIQFLKSLLYQPLVIFTTAYSQYAVESYEFAAVDYLLKPIEFERFLKAANRALEKHHLLNQGAISQKAVKNKIEFLMVKSGQDLHKIKIDNILFIESAGNYVVFHLKSEKIMSLLSMNKVLALLPCDQFFRIHKSYIVALIHINKIERHQVVINKKEIPIGNVYRESFFKALEYK